MKTLFTLALALLFLNLSCSDDRIKGKGEISKANRELSGFKSIEVSDGLNLILTKATKESVEVETYPNIQQYISTKIVNNKLLISISDVNLNVDHLKIYVSVTNLETILAEDGCAVKATNLLEFPNLNVNLKDGSNLSADIICTNLAINLEDGSNASSSITCTNLTANLKDGSNLKLSGMSESASATIEDGSNLSDYTYRTNKLICDVKDGSNMKITVNESLNVTASVGSNIKYKGNGVVTNVNLTEGSTLNKE